MRTTIERGGSDLVVSLDAFKVTRHDGGREWRVKPLTPWARDLLRPDATLLLLNEHDGQPCAQSSDGFVEPSRGDLDRGAYFPRRAQALAFLVDVERMAERWEG